MSLRDWLKNERRTQKWLGEQIGTHQTNVSAWILGRPIPLGMALKIKKLTGIEVEDWTIEVVVPDSSTNLTDAAQHRSAS